MLTFNKLFNHFIFCKPLICVLSTYIFFLLKIEKRHYATKLPSLKCCLQTDFCFKKAVAYKRLRKKSQLWGKIINSREHSQLKKKWPTRGKVTNSGENYKLRRNILVKEKVKNNSDTWNHLLRNIPQNIKTY